MNALKILLTGGRGPAVLDMARQFNEYGHEVYVAESCYIQFCRASSAVKRNFVVPNPVTHESDYIDALIDICDRYQIDVLMPNYTEIYPIAREKAHFPRHTTVFCDSIQTIDTMNNKLKFMNFCKTNGIPAPETTVISNQAVYMDRIKQDRVPYPHVIKSLYCAGGSKTITIRSKEQALAQPLEAPFILQEFIEGRIWSTYGIAHEGRLTCHASYYPWYTFRENGGAICFEAHEHAGMLALTRKVVAAAHFTGQLGFDIMEKPDGSLWLIECNPRITSGVHLMRNEVDLMSKIIDPNAVFEAVNSTTPIQLTVASMIRVMLKQKHSDFKTWLYYLLKSRDVVFDRNDLGPALMMPLIGYQYIKAFYKHNTRPEDNIFLEVDYQVDE